ncbi:hypothetical protein ACFPVX_13030 [Cohnella faecalis]|uniref:Uncharacterized protein n=1 Tax=Cohnella faecalis TaxID=2315694 RepID=A0A398CZS9_9BACL|nr:hypothetical protein [Cohnella faecalis]RIE04424.1 hypothetical protein D3H35_07520 [Cohnella faecalis]
MKRKTNPLLYVIFGVLLAAFGVIDLLYVNRLIGTALVIAGIWLGINGLRLRSQAKKNAGR